MARNVYDIVVLSSSPPEHSNAVPQHAPTPRRVATSASPPLVISPSTSPKKPAAGAPRVTLRAAPMPEGALRGFATVGSLVRSEHFANQTDNRPVEEQHRPQSRQESTKDRAKGAAATKKPRKRSTKTASTDESETLNPKRRPRKPNADKDNTIHDPDLRLPEPTKSPFFAAEPSEPPIGPLNEPLAVAPTLAKTSKLRKPQTKKKNADTEEAGSDLESKKSRVAKPKRVAKGGNPQREDAPVVSAHFQNNADPGNSLAPTGEESLGSTDHHHIDMADTPICEVSRNSRPKKKAPRKKQSPNHVAAGLDLEEAVARRRDWTPPPKDTTTQSLLTDSAGKENNQMLQDANGHFTHMLSNFAYAQLPPAQSKAANTEVMAVVKRRRIEVSSRHTETNEIMILMFVYSSSKFQATREALETHPRTKVKRRRRKHALLQTLLPNAMPLKIQLQSHTLQLASLVLERL